MFKQFLSMCVLSWLQLFTFCIVGLAEVALSPIEDYGKPLGQLPADDAQRFLSQSPWQWLLSGLLESRGLGFNGQLSRMLSAVYQSYQQLICMWSSGCSASPV